MALDKNMVYPSNMINPSATITGEAGAAIDDVRCKCVAYDTNGKLVLAGAGAAAVGIAIVSNSSATAVGQDIDVQIKDMGVALAGAAITAGAPLASNASGLLVPAVDGDFVLATALEPGVKDQVIKVQITKYKTTKASGTV